jgi:ABC-type glycerol-3-phosphate transport system substrate-binding protein
LQPSFYNQTMKRLFLLTPLLALLVVACMPATATPEPTPTVTPQPLITPATPEAPTLTLWLPDWMALPDAPGYEAMMNAITAFETEQEVQVLIIPKLPRGEGGLLDALRKTKPVAPSVLPDIVALPLRDVAPAVEDDLLQPLSGLFSEQLLDDYYPFARQASMADDAWMALPFAAYFEHLSFQPAALSEPPVNWEIVLNSGGKYVFPVGSSDSVWTDALLLHYLSATPAGASPERNEQALKAQLTFYEELYRRGLVDETLLQINAPKGSWEQALQGTAPLAETTASLWLAQRGEATFLRFGPTPTADSQARYLIHGWAYALITADEVHQTLAVALIHQLIDAQILADWSHQSYVLPARRSALQQWPADDFRAFVDEALQEGFPMPEFARDEAMTRAVHQAVRQVLSGEMTAEDAWQQAISAW